MSCGTRLRWVTEEGRRRRRCPACGFTFYDDPVPAAVALVVGRRGVLLARRGAAPYRGTWDLPGGFIEAGERPDEALRRELREELGVSTRSLRLLGFATDRYGRAGSPILALIYAARVGGEPAAGSDVAAVRWFPPDALPWRRIGFPSARRALRRYGPRR